VSQGVVVFAHGVIREGSWRCWESRLRESELKVGAERAMIQ
jgi:hypothetical protein